MFYFFLVCNIFRQLNGFSFGACPAIHVSYPFLSISWGFFQNLVHCALSSLVLPFMGKKDIPIACDNQCICQGLLITESCFVSLVPNLFLWTETVRAFLPLLAWSDLKELQQNLSRLRSLQVCLDQCNTILCQSKIWTFAETVCFVISGLKGLRWLMVLLCEH